jgi:methylenetetrahydrofolate dehydrogenase (NADP+)/methenyltetrahydrofolate cyclohydrolase
MRVAVAAQVLDGAELAAEIRAEIAVETAEFIENNGVVPTLAAVLVGDNPASEVYVRNKQSACHRSGMESVLHRLSATAAEEELLALVAKLNKDESVHGILVQLPLPASIEPHRVLSAVNASKDVDCFHPEGGAISSASRWR